MAHSARIEELRRRVQLDPASIAFAALAEQYRRAGQFEDAIAVCEAGLQRHPAYISARVTLGRSLLEFGRFGEARHQLEHVLRTAPENLAAIRALAEIHARVGDHSHVSQSDARDDAASQPPAPPPAPLLVVPPTPAASGSPAGSGPAEGGAVVELPRVGSPPPPARVPHPDEAALPALEAFLSAILAAKAPARQSFE
jgi:tetratricopeptide (TPR) repeat protein